MTTITVTGRGRSACPTLATLASAEHAAHTKTCATCRIAVTLVTQPDCERYEELLVARDDGPIGAAANELLEAHLATCPACSALAKTVAPAPGASGDLATLQTVSTSAYALGREVARGGMGRIFAARDLRIGREVAVKELLGGDAARFEREARITARLQHPGIVPIYEIGAWPDGTPFYAMRMVEGRTLGAAIAARPTLADRLALLPSLIAASEAIAFAHAHRVIHRDLTPANVLVGEFGETVVIDWGLAKDLSGEVADVFEVGRVRVEPANEGLTAIGAVMGTAAYMPPEQARGDAVDERGDVYALGALLYQLLVGAAPYKATPSENVVELVKREPPIAIEGRVASAPRDLISIAQKAMSRDPAARYPSARELAEELSRFQTGRIVEAHRYSRGELLLRWLRRHRVAVVGAIALAIAGLLGFIGVLRERDKASGIAVSLLEEQGRQELLRGDNDKALAYLNAALQQGLDTPALRFMLAQGLRDVEARKASLPCDGIVSAIEIRGDRVAAACGDQTRIWRARSLERTLVTKGVRGAAWSHDGAALATTGDRTILWDAATGAMRAELPGASFAAFDDDDRTLVTVGADGAAKHWDATSGALLRELRPGSGTAGQYQLATLRAGVLFVMDEYGHGAIWRLASRESAVVEFGGVPWAVTISDDGALVGACGSKAPVRIWQVATGALAQTIAAHEEDEMFCAFADHGAAMLLASADGTADVWQLASHAKTAEFRAQDGIYAAVASPDGLRIATAGSRSVDLWAAATGEHLARFSRSTGQLRFSDDGRDLLIASGDRIEIWDASGSLQRTTLALPVSNGLRVFQPSNDGTRAVLVDVPIPYRSQNVPLYLWDTVARKAIPHVPIYMPRTMIEATAYEGADFLSTDGSRLIAPMSDTELAVIDAHTGRTISTIPVASPTNMTLDAAGRRVVILNKGTQRIWDVDKRAEVLRLPDHVRTWALSPDGRRVLSWRDDTHVEVWEIDAQRILSTFVVVAPTTSVGFGADGNRVAVLEDVGQLGSGRLGLWDANTGARLLSVPTSSAGWDPTLKLITTYDDGRISVWRAADAARLSSAPILPYDDGRNGPMPGVSGSGQFLATAGEGTEALDIRSAADGRILAMLGIAHVGHGRLPDGTFFHQAYPPRWTPDGGGVASFNWGMSVWNLGVETRSAAEIDALVQGRIAWRVEDGKLIAVTSRLAGRVAQPGAITARLLPLGSSYTTIAKADGSYVFDALPPGVYAVGAAGAPSKTVTVEIGAAATVDVP